MLWISHCAKYLSSGGVMCLMTLANISRNKYRILVCTGGQMDAQLQALVIRICLGTNPIPTQLIPAPSNLWYI